MLGLKRTDCTDLDIFSKEKNIKIKAQLNPESRNDQEEKLEDEQDERQLLYE